MPIEMLGAVGGAGATFLGWHQHYAYAKILAVASAPLTVEKIPTGVGSGGAQVFVYHKDVLHAVLSFLSPAEAHALLIMPLCKIFRKNVTLDDDFWAARCVAETWNVPTSVALRAVGGCSIWGPPKGAWRTLHKDLVSSLAKLGALQDGKAALLAVTEVLDKYRTVPLVARACFRRLGDLLDQDVVRQEVHGQGVKLIDTAVWALIAFLDDVEMLQDILICLVKAGRPVGSKEGAVFHTSDSQNASAPLDVFGPGGEGAAAVLSVLARHPGHAKLQAAGCWSLVNLALVPEHKEHLLAGGGLEAVVRAMQAHPKDKQVQFRALFALINMVTPDKSLAHPVPDSVLKPVIVQTLEAMDHFSAEGDLVTRACLVLHNVALDGRNHSTLLRCGAPPFLIKSLEAHPHDSLVNQCVAQTLRRLGMESHGPPPAIEAIQPNAAVIPAPAF